MTLSKGVNVFRNERGQGLIEYLIIVAVVGVAAFSVIQVVGQNVSARFGSIAKVLQGHKDDEAKVNMDTVGNKARKKDLDTFFRE